MSCRNLGNDEFFVVVVVVVVVVCGISNHIHGPLDLFT